MNTEFIVVLSLFVVRMVVPVALLFVLGSVLNAAYRPVR